VKKVALVRKKGAFAFATIGPVLETPEPLFAVLLRVELHGKLFVYLVVFFATDLLVIKCKESFDNPDAQLLDRALVRRRVSSDAGSRDGEDD
jgi:hypothetical protein